MQGCGPAGRLDGLQSCISGERVRYKLPSRGKPGQAGRGSAVRRPPRGDGRALSPRAVKTGMRATQSGSACLPDRDETRRTPLLLKLTASMLTALHEQSSTPP